jgi:putative FmdB family regulatory protein
MPTYSYFCKNCDKSFDRFYYLDEKHDEFCSNCDKKLQRQFNNISVNFKGEGFYSTSFAGNGKETSEVRS